MIWTLKNAAGIERTFADWGLSAPEFDFVSQAPSTCRFNIASPDAFDADDFLEYDTLITIYQRPTAADIGTDNGRVWFVGRVQQPTRAAGAAEYQGYQLADPWQDLEAIPFAQTWTLHVGNVPVGEVFLNGQNKNTGQQIVEVLQWAMQNDACLQIGTVDVPAKIPFNQDIDKVCAAIIRDELHLSPDAVAWIDPSTTPPTFNCRRRQALPAVTLALPPDVDETSIVERYDLQLPVVVLIFLRYDTVEVNGNKQMTLVPELDIYPPNANPNQRWALKHTFWLEGSQTQFIEATIATKPHNGFGDDFWLYWFPGLNKKTGNSLEEIQVEIASGEPKVKDQDGRDVDLNEYPNVLLPDAGEIAPWMLAEYGIKSIRATVTADIFQSVYSLDKVLNSMDLVDVITEPKSVQVTLTNASSDTYRHLVSSIAAEASYAGLAQYLYETHAELHYEGEVTFTKEECEGIVRPGVLLNLSSASGRFANMRALVQRANEQIVPGKTVVRFGPPAQLGANDLMQWLRAMRWRKAYQSPQIQSGSQNAKPAHQTGGAQSSANSSSGPAASKRTVWLPDQSLGTGTKTTVDGNGIIIEGGGNRMELTAGRLKITTATGQSVDINIADLLAGQAVKLQQTEGCSKGNPVTCATVRSDLVETD